MREADLDLGATFVRYGRPSTLARSLYVAQGLARALALRAQSDVFARFVLPRPAVRPTEEEERALRARIVQLFETDWRNVREGLYPESIVRFSWRRLVANAPGLARDLPGLWRRTANDVHDDLPPGSDHFPAYYRRNFHYQQKGWLSLESARIYDAQVELLFGGTADTMRRQVLPSVVRALRGPGLGKKRILDVACGTGSVLGMLAATLPGAHLYGLDLSPHYIAEARRRLGDMVPLSLVAENAERMPFPDRYFDAAVNVYLLHELPGDVRSNVLGEVARVLKPGATFVLADSVQASEAPELARFLENFPRQFHEPYYKGYQRDDLELRMRLAGLEPVKRVQHFLTTVITARRVD